MLHVVRPAKFLALYEEAIKRVTREIDAGEYPEWMLDAWRDGDVTVVVGSLASRASTPLETSDDANSNSSEAR